MAKRQATPDLMSEILGGDDHPKPQRSKPQQQEELVSDEAIKATIYLSQKGTDALEELKFSLRRLLRPDNKHNVSKSSIVEALVLLHLAEVREKGIDSELAKQLNRKQVK